MRQVSHWNGNIELPSYRKQAVDNKYLRKLNKEITCLSENCIALLLGSCLLAPTCWSASDTDKPLVIQTDFGVKDGAVSAMKRWPLASMMTCVSSI